jgi:hypothetical protein
MKRLMMASVLCSTMFFLVQSASAQNNNMSDATGASVNLFSRGVVRAFGAPPAPPPVIQVTPSILEALCVERADALLTFATLSAGAETQAERTVLMLLRGGPGSETAAATLRGVLVQAGADPAGVEQLLVASTGLLTPGEPEVVNVAAAVAQYNALVAGAPQPMLAAPPAELTALRLALGRLTATANHAYAAERVYPGLETRGLRYANGAEWLLTGQSIQIGEGSYFPYGQATAIGDRVFKRITDFNGVWVLAEEPVPAAPATIYVPVRKYCDVELMPYLLEEKVIKKQSFLSRR